MTLTGVFLIKTGGGGKGPSFFSDGSLQGWFAQVGAVELQAAANSSCYLFEFAFFN
jgi:hypothetical protein